MQGEAAQGGERLAEGSRTAAQRLGQAAREALSQGVGAAIVDLEEEQVVQRIAPRSRRRSARGDRAPKSHSQAWSRKAQRLLSRGAEP